MIITNFFVNKKLAYVFLADFRFEYLILLRFVATRPSHLNQCPYLMTIASDHEPLHF